MAPKLCKEQILLNNNMKYSDFIAGKYVFLNSLLSRPYCLKKITSSEKIADSSLTEITGINF